MCACYCVTRVSQVRRLCGSRIYHKDDEKPAASEAVHCICVEYGILRITGSRERIIIYYLQICLFATGGNAVQARSHTVRVFDIITRYMNRVRAQVPKLRIPGRYAYVYEIRRTGVIRKVKYDRCELHNNTVAQHSWYMRTYYHYIITIVVVVHIAQGHDRGSVSLELLVFRSRPVVGRWSDSAAPVVAVAVPIPFRIVLCCVCARIRDRNDRRTANRLQRDSAGFHAI